MRILIGPLIALGLALGMTPAFPQYGPTTPDMIKTLMPHAENDGRGAVRIKEPSGGAVVSPPEAAHASPGTPQPAVTIARPIPASRDAKTAPSLDLILNFATGSADLTPQTRQVLDRLGAALSSEALSKYRFRIAGHTDSVGTKEYNKALSTQRAFAVVSYVNEHFRVLPARMEAVGMGSDKPLVATADQVAEPRNRRVEIVNIGN
jgi:OmpA-OmpF porin, OOP family